jgi:flagellar assembly protein FliH
LPSGSTEKNLVQLALLIARRLIHREISVDPDALLGLIKAVLDRVDAAETHRVRLPAGHAALVRKYLDQAGRRVEMADDPSLAPGQAIFETSRGQIDASLETQLSEIERGFADLLLS